MRDAGTFSSALFLPEMISGRSKSSTAMEHCPHPTTSESNSSTSPEGVVQPESKTIECDGVIHHKQNEDGTRWTIYTIGVYYATLRRSFVFEGIVPFNDKCLVRDQADAEVIGLAAGAHILRKIDEGCECIYTVLTDRMSTLKTLLNAVRRKGFKKRLRKTFKVVMKYFTYELVRLLVSTHNKAVHFCDQKHEAFTTVACSTQWVADWLSRNRTKTNTCKLASDPPPDLKEHLRFWGAEYGKKKLLLRVRVNLVDIDAAREAISKGCLQPDYLYLGGNLR